MCPKLKKTDGKVEELSITVLNVSEEVQELKKRIDILEETNRRYKMDIKSLFVKKPN